MIISNITSDQLNAALANTNAKHGYRLIWNRSPDRLNAKGNRFACTIRSERSKIRGARTSYSGRNIPAASWHAHGHFYEEILAVAPDAVIRMRGNKIDKDGGNWQDFNAGSQVCPAYMSELSVF